MAPKIKTTEEAIVNAAIELIRKQGWDYMNARNLAKMLGCSTQPIFRVFATMEDLKHSIYKKAEEIYNQQMLQAMQSKNSMENENPFFSMGLTYIEFSKKEKNLFKLIFMSDFITTNSIMDMLEGEDNKEVITMISQLTNLTEENAKQFFLEIWLVTHGIASMFATNSCNFSDEEIRRILSDSYTGYLYTLKKGGNKTNEG